MAKNAMALVLSATYDIIIVNSAGLKQYIQAEG